MSRMILKPLNSIATRTDQLGSYSLQHKARIDVKPLPRKIVGNEVIISAKISTKFPANSSKKSSTINSTIDPLDSESVLEPTHQERDHQEQILWYRIPRELEQWLSTRSDFLAIATIFQAMSTGADLYIHGSVSSALLANLEKFQSVWNCWMPSKYSRAQIYCDDEIEEERICRFRSSICAFTGGVDSAFSILRHLNNYCGRNNRNIEAGLFVHGFDIPLEDYAAYERAQRRANSTLSSAGVELLSLSTNYKELNIDWDYTHGAGIASALSLFSGRFDSALIGSTYTCLPGTKPWGSNCWTDNMFSSGSFTIENDGHNWSREQKLIAVSRWDEAFQELRVCWKASKKDENCSRCTKCLMTLIQIDLHDLERPKSFSSEKIEDSLQYLREPSTDDLESLETLASRLKHSSKNPPYLVQLDKCIERAKKEQRIRTDKSELRIAAQLRSWLYSS